MRYTNVLHKFTIMQTGFFLINNIHMDTLCVSVHKRYNALQIEGCYDCYANNSFLNKNVNRAIFN